MKVTLYRSIHETDRPYHIGMEQALDRIQNGKSKDTIERFRDTREREDKMSLPIVLWSGTFNKRADNELVEHSGFIVLDFDHIDIEQGKTQVGSDQYVRACWVSPSGDGLKALVKVSNPERHRDHFRAIKAYFSKTYGLEVDETGINESRACFESYDPDIIVKDTSDSFGGLITKKSEEQAPVQQYLFTDYMKLNLAARMIRQAQDGEKHATLLKAARLCGGYVSAGRMEEEEAVRVLFREICKRDIDSEEHAMATIRSGMEDGKNSPLRDIISDERSVTRELLINDGDMSFISSDDSDYRMIDDFVNGKIQVGLDTGDEELDKFFRYKREFVIINGHSNVGKTTMALYLMVNSSSRHGWKWVVYSSENSTWSLKMTLMEFATSMPIKTQNFMQRKEAYRWVNEHFTIINNNQVYSYSDIILFMEKVKRIQNIDAIFVDPYNSLKIDLKNSNIGVHDYHYEAASEFLTYSTANNVAVWLNMHAVTEAQRRKGDDGLPIAPYAEDTEGGGKFVNRADCFITIHRKVQAPDLQTRRLTEIHVRKVREVKTGGQPTGLDEPVNYVMNPTMTGFRSVRTGNELFEPIGLDFTRYQVFNE
jgi:hypothetical protein